MQRKNQFAANIMAATIQNISQQRKSGNQNLTQNDIVSAVRLAALTVFPGTTQYPLPGGIFGYSNMPLGYCVMAVLYVFTGTGDNTATKKYSYRIYPNNGNSNFYKVNATGSAALVKPDETSATSIYPEFRISSGETKCIVEFELYTDTAVNLGTSEIQVRTIPKNKLFGFLFYTPTSPGTSLFVLPAATIFNPVWNFNNSLPVE